MAQISDFLALAAIVAVLLIERFWQTQTKGDRTVKICLEIGVADKRSGKAVIRKIEALRPHLNGLGSADLCEDAGNLTVAVWITTVEEIQTAGQVTATIA